MSVESKIEWTDASWSPVVGCSKVSDGCKNCYAINHAWRLGHNPNEKINSVYAGLTKKNSDGSLNWTGEVRELPERLNFPLKIKTPKRIFVNPMADLFHEKVSDEFIYKVLERSVLADKHTYQILTKRPERMAQLVPSIEFNLQRNYPDRRHDIFSNVWFGITAENQEQLEKRIKPFLSLRRSLTDLRTVFFLSCEPLLEDLHILPYLLSRTYQRNDLTGETRYICTLCGNKLDREEKIKSCHPMINLVIAGAESGYMARPMNEDWVRSLRDRCQQAGVDFFYKQKTENKKKVSLPLLDGKRWAEMPEATR